ncbi:MAG TPA: hypothetical protein VL490_03320 [Mucilaginibacter sp.]|jgi:hypothetical protein|nr:hypothetical protein [Mucilaginibacter sp.]
MENTSFTIAVNHTEYTVKPLPGIPQLFDISCGKAYHQIGKTDAGLWVYVENPTSVQHMPLQQIGEGIEAYLFGEDEE